MKPDPLSATDQPVYDQAVRWLARRSYGEVELARRLATTLGVTDEVTARVVARCRGLGYLNDLDFAQARVRVRLRRGYGPLRVRAELLSLGVDGEIVALALKQWYQEQDPLCEAAAALEKKFGAYQEQGLDFKVRRRQYDFLARRGFDSEVIVAVLSGRSEGCDPE